LRQKIFLLLTSVTDPDLIGNVDPNPGMWNGKMTNEKRLHVDKNEEIF
jgi:hypothetical protein